MIYVQVKRIEKTLSNPKKTDEMQNDKTAFECRETVIIEKIDIEL